MSGYFTQQVQYAIYYPQKVFNLPSVITNVSILTILLSVVHTAYFKIGQACKERIKASIHHWNRIVYSLWQIGCSFFMIIICLYRIFTHQPTAMGDILDQETNQVSEVSFSLICAFHLHSACLSCKVHGFSRVSIRWLVATVALCLSYAARCLRIGVIFVLVWSIISLVMDMIRLFINTMEIITQKPVGGTLSLSIAVFFSVVWAVSYVYIYPLFVLLPVSALNSSNSSVSLMSLFLLALWSEYVLDWYSTPFIRFLRMSTTRSYPANWLSNLFYMRKNEVAEKLLLIRKGEREKEQIMVNHFAQSEEMKTRQNSQTVVQTIKCVLLLKKKLRRIRERKNLEMSEKSENNSEKQESPLSSNEIIKE